MGKMSQFRRLIRDSANKPVLYHGQDGYGAVLLNMFSKIGHGGRLLESDIHEVMSATRADLLSTTIAGRSAEIDDDGEKAKRVVIAAGPTVIPTGTNGKSIAIVPVRGVAMYDLEYQPYCFSTMLLAKTMKALSGDPDIATIILDIDSPGGMVTGTREAGDAVYAAAKKKNVVALVNPLCASAAYWIASQASEILAIPSADIGSIGVFMAHTDCSKFNEMQGMKVTYIYAGEFKVEGNSDEPLSDAAKAYYQSEVDDLYQSFLSNVARGRKTSVKDVFDNFGKGRCMNAAAAKKCGMIDDFMTIDEAMVHCGVPTGPSTRGRARADGEAPVFASTDGCKSFGLMQVEKAPDDVKVYVTADWPAKCSFTESLISEPSAYFKVSGGHVVITVENGAAVYHKLGVTEYGDWVCALVHGEYEPMPAAATESEESEEDTEAKRKKQDVDPAPEVPADPEDDDEDECAAVTADAPVTAEVPALPAAQPAPAVIEDNAAVDALVASIVAGNEQKAAAAAARARKLALLKA